MYVLRILQQFGYRYHTCSEHRNKESVGYTKHRFHIQPSSKVISTIDRFVKCSSLTHWLRVAQRVEFKLAVLVYRCLNGQGPPYLASDLHRVADLDTRRRLLSSSSDALTVPLTHLSTVGDRAISVATARVWNSLPASVTSSPLLSTFKRNLKTELFARSYPAR